MVTDRSHYQVLGVDRSASLAEIRRSYRALARRHHPDLSPGVNADESTMARINEAWNVLSDKKSRARYDLTFSSPGNSTTTTRPDDSPEVRIAAPAARFPWRGMILLAVIGACLVLVAHAFTKPPPVGTPDQLISAGSCVDIDAQMMAVEVACGGPHEAVVSQLIATDRICPTGTESYQDRQGMGIACVIPVLASGGVQQQGQSG